MNSRESNQQPPPQPPPSQSQLHSQPVMMIGPPNVYSQGLFNGNSSSSGIPSTMMQNPCFSLSPPGQSAPVAGESANAQLDGRSTSQEGPPGFIGDSEKKKKRGRPRKYPLDSGIGLGLGSDSGPCSPSASLLPASARATSHENSTPDGPALKKNKGRPPNSGKKQTDDSGFSGLGYTPHMLLIEAGEDIAEKVNAFSLEGPRNVCIISANGAICNATLLQSSFSDRAVTYEGRFQILTFGGSFSPPDASLNRPGSQSISVSLAGSDGRVLGGSVTGKLIAATQVQVILGSFIAEGAKKQPSSKPGTSQTPKSKPDETESPVSEEPVLPPMHENGSSPTPPTAPFGNIGQQHHQGHNMQVFPNMGWGNTSMKM